MHRKMMWPGHHKSFGDWSDMEIPTIPAPVAMCALVVGLVMGMIVGKKKAMMHGMMGRGMMGGGMMGGHGYGYGYGGKGEWMRKKAMMYGHHHHGDGAPPCWCGEYKGESHGMHEGPPEGEASE